MLRALQVGTGFKPINQKVSASLKGPARQHVVVVPQVGAVGESALLADGFDVGLLRGGCHEDRRIVAEDARQDHDNGDGDQDPVATSRKKHHVSCASWSCAAGTRTRAGGPCAGSELEFAP